MPIPKSAKATRSALGVDARKVLMRLYAISRGNADDALPRSPPDRNSSDKKSRQAIDAELIAADLAARRPEGGLAITDPGPCVRRPSKRGNTGRAY